jgi:hypothetical protein
MPAEALEHILICQIHDDQRMTIGRSIVSAVTNALHAWDAYEETVGLAQRLVDDLAAHSQLDPQDNFMPNHSVIRHLLFHATPATPSVHQHTITHMAAAAQKRHHPCKEREAPGGAGQQRGEMRGAMPIQEMDRRIALLRLLLADITAREREANEAIIQLRKQLQRIVDFTVQYNGGVAGALSSLSEVEERLTQQEVTLHHLGMLRERAGGELQALLVTRGVTDARARLAELEAKRLELSGTTPASTAPVDADAPPRNHLISGSGGGITTGTAAQETGEREQRIAEIDAEIAELLAQIHAASEAAVRALTSSGSGDPPSSTQ